MVDIMNRGGLRQREAVPSLTELREQGYQAIGIRVNDERSILFATRNQNLDLTDPNVFVQNPTAFRAFEMDRRGNTTKELSEREMRTAIGLPAPFVQEAQASTLQQYRRDIEEPWNSGDKVLAIQRGLVQWQHAPADLAPQMARVFEDVTGFSIEEVPGRSEERIAAFLQERGVTRVARAPEVREEPRVAGAGPTEQTREVDLALFEGGLNSYTSIEAAATERSRELGLAQAVRMYDRITGYAPEQAAELQAMFREKTGMNINSPEVRGRVARL